MKSPAAMTRVSGLASILVLGAGLQAQPQGLAPVHLDDNSDWWSAANAAPAAQKATSQKRKISDKNFEILGVVLSEDMFSLAGTEFGSVRPVVRGDAANFREQACYSLPAREFLIFEHGEVNDGFYLFAGGAPWKGQDTCVPSSRAPASFVTGSGLHLGQTPEQVTAILGQPSERTPDQLLYLLESKRPATSDEIALLQKQHPELNEPQPPKSLEFDVTVVIVAKFVKSELNYLAVSKAESTQPETKKP